MPSITEVTFSANPDVGATLGASAHLIPQVSLELNALDGAASTSVFLDLDASLGLQGNVSSVTNPQPCLSGNAEINVGVGAQGSFFGLFDASTGKSLFDKNFPLFQVRAHSPLYTCFFFEYLPFFLHDDSNASAGTRIRRIRRRLRLVRQTPLRPIPLRRLARPMPLRPIPLRRLARPMPPRPIPLRRLALPMSLRPIPPRRLAPPMPLRPIPLRRLARLMSLLLIPLLRLALPTPLQRPIQGVTSTLPEQYDTAHGLDDHILLFPLELALISIPNFETLKSDIYYLCYKCS
jgi:hypothetical protein